MIQEIRIDDTDVYLKDDGPGRGKITISNSYGHNYSYFWGAMGSNLQEFICRIDDCYFAGNLIGQVNRNVMDVKATFAAVRKFMRQELGLAWYVEPEFQKHMREKLRDFQDQCQQNPSKELFVERFFIFLESLNFYMIENDQDEKNIRGKFKYLDVPWHFIETKPSREYNWLTAFHKKLVKHLKEHK